MKTIGKILIIIFICTNAFCAQIFLKKDKIKQGEIAILKFEVIGHDIKMPKIDKIGEYKIISKQKIKKTILKNNKKQILHEYFYTFLPDESVKIKSFDILVDGKIQKTNQLYLEVEKIVFIDLNISSNEIYLGELLKLELNAKYQKDKVSSFSIQMPNLKDFYIKQIIEEKQIETSDFIMKKISYFITPKRVEEFVIHPFFAHVIKLEKHDKQNYYYVNTKILQIKTKEKKIKVKNLPKNINIIGDFNFTLSVDKFKIKANEPLNASILIKGYGNIDEINPFDLNASAIVFQDKPKIKEQIINGKIQGEFSQKFSFIANHDFNISQINFSYFDIKTNKIKTLTSKTIMIKVISENKKFDNKNNYKIISKTNKTYVILAFMIGLTLGILITFFIKYFKFNLKKQTLLQDIIIYYGKNKALDKWIEKLEENYKLNKKHKINKKEIQSLINKINLKL